MELVWVVFQILVAFNLVLPLFLFACAPIEKNSYLKLKNEDYDYAIIITAYEETAFLEEVVRSILKMNYDNYLIYLVADNCDISKLNFESEKVIVLKPEHTLANNVKSHFYAIEHFRRSHDVLTIIDSDNLVHSEYINELNVWFNQGFKAVQGVRKPKKLDTNIAILDAVRDMYYHFYDGELLFKLGSSATLAGSGMAFKTSLYRQCLKSLDIFGAGFDKVLQFQLVKRNIRIAFANKAVVYDEKTKSSNQLIKQRSRWINSWFKYFKYGFRLIGIGLKQKQINPLLFGTILLRPPLFIFIILSSLCLLINLVSLSIATYLWLMAFLAFFFSFYLALKKQNASPTIYNALWGVPKFVFLQLLALFSVKNANKHSVATKHQVDL